MANPNHSQESRLGLGNWPTPQLCMCYYSLFLVSSLSSPLFHILASISNGKKQKMQFQTLIGCPSHTPLFQNTTQKRLSLYPRFHAPLFPSNLSLASTPKSRRNRIITACISPTEASGENDGGTVSVSGKVLGVVGGEESGSEERQSIWNQMKEIVKFTGPATGLWICGPLMSLIDTVVIGQGSSIELAALGTVFSCEFGVV
jgi:hypothetical protein